MASRQAWPPAGKTMAPWMRLFQSHAHANLVHIDLHFSLFAMLHTLISSLSTTLCYHSHSLTHLHTQATSHLHLHSYTHVQVKGTESSSKQLRHHIKQLLQTELHDLKVMAARPHTSPCSDTKELIEAVSQMLHMDPVTLSRVAQTELSRFERIRHSSVQRAAKASEMLDRVRTTVQTCKVRWENNVSIVPSAESLLDTGTIASGMERNCSILLV